MSQMNDSLKQKINSNPDLKKKLDLIVINYFPILPEGLRVELSDLGKNKETMQKIKNEVMALEGLSESEKRELLDHFPKLYINILNDHNKKVQEQNPS